MRKESFEAAFDIIKDYFFNDNLKAYTTFDISNIFENHRENWKIAGYRNSNHFINFLEKSNILKMIKLKHQTTSSIKKILIEPNANYFNIGLTIKKDGYLSNYTAMQIHNLTLQIPKSIYVSHPKVESRNSLKNNNINISQDSIDKAFTKPQRITSEVYKSEIDNYRLLFIQKGYTENNIGIINNNGIRYTDLERTLIDIAIRPAYSGGVFEVLEAFINAREHIDINKLNNYLSELNYIYPFHQLLGFYMDKANYDSKKISILFNQVSKYKFYLTYNMSNKEYDEKWKIYYPKGF